MERVEIAMHSKMRTGGGFGGNTYFPKCKIRGLDTHMHAI